MFLDALTKIQGFSFGYPKGDFAGNGQEQISRTGVEAYGTGQGINGTNSSGVNGEVTGTGKNGKHLLDRYM